MLAKARPHTKGEIWNSPNLHVEDALAIIESCDQHVGPSENASKEIFQAFAGTKNVWGILPAKDVQVTVNDTDS